VSKPFLAVLCLTAWHSCAGQQSFDKQFETIKSTATRQQLYALLWDLPKGGDLHNHFG
jgi:adenosine deaminase CECR1